MPNPRRKKQFKSAVKLGFETILERFTKDVEFASRATERGLTRSAMLIQDAIATTVLPNPDRTTEQRTMGVGSQLPTLPSFSRQT